MVVNIVNNSFMDFLFLPFFMGKKNVDKNVFLFMHGILAPVVTLSSVTGRNDISLFVKRNNNTHMSPCFVLQTISTCVYLFTNKDLSPIGIEWIYRQQWDLSHTVNEDKFCEW